MQAIAAGQQVAGAGPGARHALQRVVGEQTQQVEQAGAPRIAGARPVVAAVVEVADLIDPEVVERGGVVRLEMVQVETEHAREGGALHELLGAGAHGSRRVHHDLPVVHVEAQ